MRPSAAGVTLGVPQTGISDDDEDPPGCPRPHLHDQLRAGAKLRRPGRDKKLAGAAKTSFLTKCEKDATAACDKQAADKKLAGAAKTSFTKKCVTDSVGT